MTFQFKHLLALPAVDWGKGAPACDMAVGINQALVNSLLAQIHTAGRSLFKGEFVDTQQTGLKVAWDVARPPTLAFQESADGLDRLARRIDAEAAFLGGGRTAGDSVRGLRNLCLEIAVPQVSLTFSGGPHDMKADTLVLGCRLFAYITLTPQGELRILPFAGEISSPPPRDKSEYRDFLLGLINLFLPDLLVEKLTPALQAATGAFMARLPDFDGVSFGALQLFFKSNCLILGARVAGERASPPPLPLSDAVTKGLFAFASFPLVNRLANAEASKAAEAWKGEKSDHWTIFSWGMSYSAWLGQIAVSKPAKTAEIADSFVLNLALFADLHLNAGAPLIKARLDGSLTENSGMRLTVGALFKPQDLPEQKPPRKAPPLYDLQVSVRDDYFYPSIRWHSNIWGLGKLLNFLSGLITGILDLPALFGVKVTRTVKRGLMLGRSIALQGLAFDVAFSEPRLATVETGVVFTGGLVFQTHS